MTLNYSFSRMMGAEACNEEGREGTIAGGCGLRKGFLKY